MDFKTIADALAARFVNVTATNGSSTETATATADLPDSVGKGPVLLVYPPATGDLEVIMGPKLNDHYQFPVRMLRDPVGGYAVRTQWLYAWSTAMRTKVQQSWTLGGVAAQAEAVGFRSGIEGHTYASVDGTKGLFDVVELIVDVHVYELTTIGI